MFKIKLVIYIISLLVYSASLAQITPKNEIKETINIFFEGFHKQDSIILTSVPYPKIIIQTIGLNKDGKTVVKNQDFNTFLNNILIFLKP